MWRMASQGTRAAAPTTPPARNEASTSLAAVSGWAATQVRGGAKAIQPQPPRVACHPQGACSDEPRAQKGRDFGVRVAIGERKAVALVGDRQLRVSAVDLVPGESRLVAEILPPRAAVFANAAGPAQ